MIIDVWNRVIFEAVQVNPTDFGKGFCSGRLWINGVLAPISYPCNFSTGVTLFSDMNNAMLELCTKKIDGQANTIDTTRYTYADIMNFMWIKGTQHLFTNQSGKIFHFYLGQF